MGVQDFGSGSETFPVSTDDNKVCAHWTDISHGVCAQ